MLPDCLATFDAMLARYPKCRVLSARSEWSGNDWLAADDTIHQSRCPYLMVWLRRCWLTPGDTLIHRSLPEHYGMFDERTSFYEDSEFFLRMLQSGCVAYTQHKIRRYNQMPTGLSLSRHKAEKEFAWYYPELSVSGLWRRAVMYEILTETMDGWRDDAEMLKHYDDMARQCFAWYHKHLHWLRQKLKRIHWI